MEQKIDIEEKLQEETAEKTGQVRKPFAREHRTSRWVIPHRIEILYTVIVTMIGLAIVLYLKDLLAGGKAFISSMTPILYGLVIAFVLNVPMSAISNFFEKHTKEDSFLHKEKNRDRVSLLLTLFVVALIIVVFALNIVPYVIRSVVSISENLRNGSDLISSFLGRFEDVDIPAIQNLLQKYSWEDLFQNLASSTSSMISIVAKQLPQIGNSLSTWTIATIIAVYILIDKRRLGRQTRTVIRRALKPKVADGTLHVCRLFSETYYRFFSGQCVESLILGTMMTVGLSLLKVPYAGMIGLMAGLFKFVPYVGTLVAWIVGGVLVLFTTPGKFLLYLIVYQVILTTEDQLIYPRVVGGSVGLPALFTIIAVVIGGKLFGLLGMLFFIPLTAVLYQLLREFLNREGIAEK